MNGDPLVDGAALTASVSNAQSYGEHNGWDRLGEGRFSSPGGLRDTEDLNQSATLQRAHFDAFFATQFCLRHPVSEALHISVTADTLRDGLRRMAHPVGPLWFQMQMTLKARAMVRRRAWGSTPARRARHRETLEGWLGYWRDAEAKATHSLRRLAGPARATGPPPPPGQPGPFVHIPDAIKCQVVWDFYWLLRAQVGQRLKRYHMRVLALLRLRRQRREAPRDAVLEGPGHPLLGSSFHDFESGRPQTLRAVDAALFMEWLQKPKCEYVAGVDLKLKDFLQLANGPNIFQDGDAYPSAVRHASPTVLAFLSSRFCTEPEWLVQRHANPQPVIPPNTTWTPSPPPQFGSDDLPKLDPVPFSALPYNVRIRLSHKRSPSKATAKARRDLTPTDRWPGRGDTTSSSEVHFPDLVPESRSAVELGRSASPARSPGAVARARGRLSFSLPHLTKAGGRI
eukprot:EG_transcript_7199